MSHAIQTYFPGFMPPLQAAKKSKPEKSQPSRKVRGYFNFSSPATVSSEKNTPKNNFPGFYRSWGGTPFDPYHFPQDIELPTIPATAPYIHIDDVEAASMAYHEIVKRNPGILNALRAPNHAARDAFTLQRLLTYNNAETALTEIIANKEKNSSNIRNAIIGSVLLHVKGSSTINVNQEWGFIEADFAKTIAFFKGQGIPEVWLDRQWMTEFLEKNFPDEYQKERQAIFANRRISLLNDFAALPTVDESQPLIHQIAFRLEKCRRTDMGALEFDVIAYKGKEYWLTFTFEEEDGNDLYDVEVDGTTQEMRLSDCINWSFSHSLNPQHDRAKIKKDVFLFLTERFYVYARQSRQRGRPRNIPAKECSMDRLPEKFGFKFDNGGYLQGFAGEKPIFDRFDAFLSIECPRPEKDYKTLLNEFVKLRADLEDLDADLYVFEGGHRACGSAAIPSFAMTGLMTERDRRGRPKYAVGEGVPVATGMPGVPTGNIVIGEKGKKRIHRASVAWCDNKSLCFGCNDYARSIFKGHMSALDEVIAADDSLDSCMLTLTIPHGIQDLMSDMRPRFESAFRSFKKKIQKEIPGFIGFAYNPEHPFTMAGWHLHMHVIVVIRGQVDEAAINQAGAAIWAAECLKSGFSPSERGFMLTHTRAAYLGQDKPPKIPGPMKNKAMEVLGIQDGQLSLTPFLLGAFALAIVQDALDTSADIEESLKNPLVLHYLDYARATRGMRRFCIDKAVMAIIPAQERPESGTPALFFDTAEEYYEFAEDGTERLVKPQKAKWGEMIHAGRVEYMFDEINSLMAAHKDEELLFALQSIQGRYGSFYVMPPESLPPDKTGKTPPESAIARKMRSLDFWIAEAEKKCFWRDGVPDDVPYLIQLAYQRLDVE